MAESEPPATPKPSGRTGSGDLIAAIMSLHSLRKPAAEIARRLHVDQATVLHALKHGTLPVRQLSMLWIDEPQASPYEQETSR